MSLTLVVSIITDEYGNETIYIGIGSLFEKDENLIVDWRSPIASLYYEGVKAKK